MTLDTDGLLIFDIKNVNFLHLLQDTIRNTLNYNDLDCLHNNIQESNLNDLRLKCFLAINKLNNWETNFFDLISEKIEDLLGPDLLIQRKLNLSIQMPNDHTSILSMHSDTLSGQSPYEIVLWLPLTNAFSSNAMFYFDIETSNAIRDDMILNEEKGLEFLRMKYWHKHKLLCVQPGQIALFSSTIFHGNILNSTNKTRISINCRFKNLYSPEVIESINERGVGIFYKLLKFSPLTKLAINYTNKEDIFL